MPKAASERNGHARTLRARPQAKTQPSLPQSLFQTSLLPPNNLFSLDVAIATHQKEPRIQTKPKLIHQKSSQVRNLRHCIPHASSRVAAGARVGRLIRVSRSQLPRTSNTFTYAKMQFTKVLFAAAAFALANAQVEFTMGSTFFAAAYTAGVSSMNLTWDLNSGPVTLKLKNGPKTALNTVALIACKEYSLIHFGQILTFW
jgi:hypothetical protein